MRLSWKAEIKSLCISVFLGLLLILIYALYENYFSYLGLNQIDIPFHIIGGGIAGYFFMQVLKIARAEGVIQCNGFFTNSCLILGAMGLLAIFWEWLEILYDARVNPKFTQGNILDLLCDQSFGLLGTLLFLLCFRKKIG